MAKRLKCSNATPLRISWAGYERLGSSHIEVRRTGKNQSLFQTENSTTATIPTPIKAFVFNIKKVIVPAGDIVT